MSGLNLSRILFAAGLLAAGVAHAGGPLSLCNAGTPSGAPITYANPNVTLNYDKGTLGTLSNAQAATIVNNAIALWNNVPTATIALTRGADMPVDVTTANVITFYDYDGSVPLTTDGLNPVIYDTDGSITDLIFGTGANGSVLGFAGSFWSGCHYVEGQAVINGNFSSSPTLMTTVLAHELGHFIGLSHTEINSEQGLSSGSYPLMYPVAHRSGVSLADDDISAITALYPDTNVAASYGTLQGNFRTAGGTQVPGANIWARENSSGKMYSVVSDYLTQGNGFFKMLLPPGTYTLHARALDASDPGTIPPIDLTGGSGTGPYTGDITDASFQPPLYTLPNGGGTPLNVTLGNGTPNQVVIIAGCVASADFRITGAGSVSGNCVAAPPPVPVAGHLAAISTRMQVLGGDNVPIAGFIVGGGAAKQVAVRALGPSLLGAVVNPLADPTLNIVPAAGGGFADDDWALDPNAGALSSAGFAPSNAKDSAILLSATPGAYTAIESGHNGLTGVGLVEVYEVDHPEIPITAISTRGFVGTGDNVMIGGIIVQGDTPLTVVLRARGPSLAASGVTGLLANPLLQLVSNGSVIASNDDWQSDPNAALISSTGFAPSDPHESALRVTLNPGAYTAIVSGVGGTTGVGIVEVFAQ